MRNIKSVKTVCMWNERKNIKHPIVHQHTRKPNTRNVIELAESVSDKALGNPSDQGGAETDENWYYDCTMNPGIYSVLFYSCSVIFSQNQVSFTICPQGNIVNWWCCNNKWNKWKMWKVLTFVDISVYEHIMQTITCKIVNLMIVP